MASEQFQRLYARLSALRSDGPALDLRSMRESMEAGALPTPDDVVIEHAAFAGLTGEWIAAPGVPVDRVIFYIHGGGFVMGSPNTHRKLATDLSRASHARVLLLDYPLAPETAFPGQVLSLTLAASAVLAEFGAQNVVVVGDSAGGGLVISCMLELRDRAHVLPVAAVCLSPWADLARINHADSPNVASDPIVRPQDTKQMADWYLQGGDASDPLASPARADLAGLPPLLIQVGSSELLLEDAESLAAKALDDGVSVTLEIWPDMVHVWQMFAGRVPEATEAVERIGQFVKAAFVKPG